MSYKCDNVGYSPLIFKSEIFSREKLIIFPVIQSLVNDEHLSPFGGGSGINPAVDIKFDLVVGVAADKFGPHLNTLLMIPGSRSG